MTESTALDSKAERIAKAIERLQSNWPTGIVLGGTVPSFYDTFPHLFTAAFPVFPEAQLEVFGIASRLFANSIFLHDKLYDRSPDPEAAGSLVPVNAVRIVAMQWESYHLLHGLFPATSVFWEDFRGYLAEFAGACVDEQQFIVGNRSWLELSEGLALEVARAKNGIARTTLAGLAALSDARACLAPLLEALDGYNAASQMLDDLRDWKEDLRSGTPSLVLVRAAGEKPTWSSTDELDQITAEIGRQIFYGGHATHVLTLAINELDKAMVALEAWPTLAWRTVHSDRRKECVLLRDDLDRIVNENVQRLATQESFEITLPAPQDAWQTLAWQALQYVIAQWQLGFGEARHIMEFPPSLGFSGPQFQRSDTFQRALIAETLCEVNAELDDALRPIVDNEVRYLLGRRGPDAGGWSYFPELPELPPDADDLAQVMQVLWLSGHGAEISESCSTPLSILLDGANADGSFETWIVPSSNRTVREHRQLDFVNRMWGTGPDPEVIANLLYALLLVERNRYSAELDRGVRYLISRQSRDGSWESTWYHGPYYGTYACLRLLGQTEFARDSVQKATAFLRHSQNADGGWGLGETSNALDTSLALLGLAQLHANPIKPQQYATDASRALTYLTQQAGGDGGFPSCEFIRMEVGRATQGPTRTLSYGSQTITTSFALKASMAWHKIASSAEATASNGASGR